MHKKKLNVKMFFSNLSFVYRDQTKTKIHIHILCHLHGTIIDYGSLKCMSYYRLSYLNNSVFGWPASLSLEHGVDAGREGHGHWLLAGRGNVPLSRVFMQFVMIQTLERRVSVTNHLTTVFLKKEK